MPPLDELDEDCLRSAEERSDRGDLGQLRELAIDSYTDAGMAEVIQPTPAQTPSGSFPSPSSWPGRMPERRSGPHTPVVQPPEQWTEGSDDLRRPPTFPNRSRSAPPARQGSAEHRALEQPGSSLVFLWTAVVLLVIGLAIVIAHMFRSDEPGSDPGAAWVALQNEREPLYEQLDALLAGGAEIANNACGAVTGVREDAAFQFRGAGLDGFPTRELRAVSAQRSAVAPLQHVRSSDEPAPTRLGDAVVGVKVLDWRRPRLDPARRDEPGLFYRGLRPGYLIGEAHIASTNTGQVVCSFRFFAANSREVQRVTPGDSQADLTDNLLEQTWLALEAGVRGEWAEPGETPGRYEALTPPARF